MIHRTQFDINYVETAFCPCRRFCFQSTVIKHFLLYTLPVLSKLDSEETTLAAAHIFVVAYKKQIYSKQRNI